MPTASLPGGEIYYEREGTGAPALVFVHGGYCTHADFTAQVRALKDDFTVLTLDLRGHGSSSGDAGEFTVYDAARDVNDLIDALSLGPVVLVGHSLGTRVILQAAADRPENALGVILVDGSRMRTVPVPADAPQFLVTFGEAVDIWDIESFDMEGTPMTVLAAGTTTTPYLDQLEKHLPNLRVEILPDAGHFLMFEAPDRVTRAVERFASTLHTA